jgi:hypothetical protein
MGQHKHNPTAIAAARGELSKADRKPVAKTGGGTMRSVLAIVGVGNTRTYFADGAGVIRHRFPKVRGKANVKRSKKARRLSRESIVRIATAA